MTAKKDKASQGRHLYNQKNAKFEHVKNKQSSNMTGVTFKDGRQTRTCLFAECHMI